MSANKLFCVIRIGYASRKRIYALVILFFFSQRNKNWLRSTFAILITRVASSNLTRLKLRSACEIGRWIKKYCIFSTSSTCSIIEKFLRFLIRRTCFPPFFDHVARRVGFLCACRVVFCVYFCVGNRYYGYCYVEWLLGNAILCNRLAPAPPKARSLDCLFEEAKDDRFWIWAEWTVIWIFCAVKKMLFRRNDCERKSKMFSFLCQSGIMDPVRFFLFIWMARDHYLIFEVINVWVLKNRELMRTWTQKNYCRVKRFGATTSRSWRMGISAFFFLQRKKIQYFDDLKVRCL